MKICIAYESKYGNGKKCSQQLGAVLTKKGQKVDVLNMRESNPKSMPQADIYIFSSPTHMGNAPFKVKGFLKNLKIPSEGAKYALMATCMDEKCKTLGTMDERLKPKGMKKATDNLLLKVTGMKGPLEEGFEKKIEQFAAKIISSK